MMKFLIFSFLGLTSFVCGGAPRQSAQRREEPRQELRVPAAESVNVSRRTGGGLRGRAVLLGWYCPQLVAGRPGILALTAKDLSWSDSESQLLKIVGTRRARRFSIVGWFGRKVGEFTVAGVVDRTGIPLASGAYSGGSACERSSLGQASQLDPTCVARTHGCAVGVASLVEVGGFESAPYDENPKGAKLSVSGACEVENVLVVDVDGDDRKEHFLLDAILRGEVPGELPVAPTAKVRCQPNFASAVSKQLVRVATMDVDDDGRVDILYRRGEDEFLLYSALNQPGRLELLGHIDGELD